jgi:lysophospholipase L1-like esterase
MSPFKVVTLGDSVAWGQGLKPGQKFNQRAADQIATRLGVSTDQIQRQQFAHSGAYLRESETKPRLDPSRHRAWAEVPWGTPTIFEQAQGPPDPDVDLVLLTAGINDIGFPTILDPTGTRDDLDRGIRENCYYDVKQLLGRVRQRYPAAVIMVGGYYPLLSEQSDLKVARVMISLLRLATQSTTGARLVSEAIGRRVARRVRFFARRQLYWLRVAVTETNGDAATRGPGILFAHPALGPRHSVGAPDNLLFSPDPPDSLQDWWRRFKDRPVIEALNVNPNDPMIDAREKACQAYQHRLGAISQAKCEVASIGHPNQAGAQRYTTAIVSSWARNHRISLRDDLEKLNAGGGPLSLRGELARYGLADNPLSVRGVWPHMIVDALAVAIRTQDQTFAGTNHDVYLQVAPGHKWRLNEKIFGGDLFDDFRPGLTTLYTLDPAEGDLNRRLHLGEIKELTLVLQWVASLPEGPWHPDWLRLEINGRQVHRQEIDTALQISVTNRTDTWTGNYPH